MTRDPTHDGTPTRRDYIRNGAALGGGLLAGCTVRSDPADGADSTDATETVAAAVAGEV